MYTAALEPDGILRLELSGFLDRTSAEKFLGEVLAIIPAARYLNGGVLRSIGVARFMPVQMALSVDYLTKIARAVLAEPGDCSGLVVRSALVRMQLERFLPKDQVVVFADEDAARAWLRTLAPGDQRKA